MALPYTISIHEILSPHTEILRLLLTEPSRISQDETIPAKSWLESKKYPLNTMVPFSGLLSIAERAQISNWFEREVSKDKSARVSWLGLLPLAHAFTIYISAGLKDEIPERYGGLTGEQLLNEAWRVQISEALPLSVNIDIERECIEDLEDEMFEVSSRAGIAGHYQWGLDAGSHQNNWDPYSGLSSSLNHGDYENIGDDQELCVSD